MTVDGACLCVSDEKSSPQSKRARIFYEVFLRSVFDGSQEVNRTDYTPK
jgi:hypothetical protein